MLKYSYKDSHRLYKHTVAFCFLVLLLSKVNGIIKFTI
jgi:hypothetical protein